MKRKYSFGSRRVVRRKKYKSYVPRPIPSVTPASQVVRLPYVTHFQLSNASIGEDYRIFRGASIYDPDLTGVGHQPLGHDQWANIYSRYRVISTKITVWAANGLVLGNSAYLTLSVARTSGLTSTQDMAEQAGAKITMVPAGANQSKMLTMYKRTRQVIGDKGSKYDEDYTAPFGSNPASDYYFYVAGKQTVGGANLEIGCCVKMEFYVEMYDKIDLTVS